MKSALKNRSNNERKSSADSKIEEFLNILMDIEKSYPMLEQLTDEVYKVICEKSKLFSDLSLNYKEN